MTDKDRNIPWPEGSWLTWNEETESWEKHEGPLPEEAPRKKTSAADASTTQAKPASTTRRTTTAKHATTTKPTGRGETSKKATWEPAAPTGTVRTPSPAVKPREQISTEASAWRPVAEGATPVARPPASVPILSDPPESTPTRRPERVREASETTLLPTIAAGCVVGVLAGYLLSFLIR